MPVKLDRRAHAQRPDTVSWGHVLRVDSPPSTQGRGRRRGPHWFLSEFAWATPSGPQKLYKNWTFPLPETSCAAVNPG